MTKVHLTEAQARKLGIDVPKGRSKGSSKRAGGVTRCVTCDEEFTGETAEARHNAETHHNRFESVVT